MGKTIYGFIEKIYMFFVDLLFKIIKKDLTDKKRQTFKEFLQFGLVGVSNTIISYLLYVVTLLLVSKSGVKFDYIIANIVSWLLSVLWSFYWNNKFVFKKEEGEKRKALEIAKNALLEGLDVGVISKISGLDIKTIGAIKKQINS